MSVVLSILQVIGWILLILFFVAIIVLLCVLFCPVRYLVEGEWLEEKWAKAKVHWLLHLFRVRLSYGDDLVYGEVGILWKKITFSFDFTKKEEKTEKELENDTEDVVETVQEKIIGTETVEELRGETIEAVEESLTEEQKESIISKIKGILEHIKEVYAKVKKILQDEKNKSAIRHLKEEVIYLIKIVLPKKSKIDAVFSTGSPDTTGQLFGVLACFPAMYHRDWKLLPDFEADEAYFKGTFSGKGRISGYQIVGIVLRILFDKNCRRLYTMINRFIKWMKKGEKSEGK